MQLAVKGGLDAALVRNVLANSESFAIDVRQDEAQARDLGIHSVPFFVINGHHGVSGAQSPEVLLQVIEQARPGSGSVQNLPEGAQCGPDGC